MDGEVINVPIELMQQFSKTKKLKELAAALMLKKCHRNSTLYNLTIKNIVGVFGVSKPTAIKLRKTLEESELFIYNPWTNSLKAKSFKSKDFRQYGVGRKFFKSNSDYCVKIYEDTKDLRLHDVVVLLRKKLIANAIDAPRKRITYKASDNSSIRNERPFTPSPTTLRLYASAISMSKSSAGRYIRQMVRDEDVRQSEIVAELVIPYYTAEKLSDYMEQHRGTYVYMAYSQKWHNFMCYRILGRRFSIANSELQESFKNVIYKHPKRIHAMAEKTIVNEGYCGTPDFFYDNAVKGRIY